MSTEDAVANNVSVLTAKSYTQSTLARQSTGEQLLISACGRTCSIDVNHSRHIVDLQAALQRTLQMEGQAFHICDINGALLSTDMQVQDAIAQGLTPLCATLPDKSLHHLENRREELAQMQWKLVRDQMTQGTNQTTSLTRQLNELQFQVQAIQREHSQNFEQFRAETFKALEMERVTSRAELHPVQEAVNGTVLLINGERSKRELSVQGFEKHIHGVCDMLDGERASRRQDLAVHMSMLQELRTHLDLERSGRTELEEQLQDMKRFSAKFQDDILSSLRDQAELITRVQADASSSLTDIMGRFVELEDRSAGLENSLSETTAWTTGSLDKLGERHERNSQATETVRFAIKNHEGSIAMALERVAELEGMIRNHHREMDNSLSKEKQTRDDQVRRSSQMFTSESLKQITEVEKRLTVRLERESAEREKNFTFMIDEVTRVVEDRKLFRDQTITKTVEVPETSKPHSPGPARNPEPAVNRGRAGSGFALSSGPGEYQLESGGMLGTPLGSYQPAPDGTGGYGIAMAAPDGTQERVRMGSNSVLKVAEAPAALGRSSARSETPQKARVVGTSPQMAAQPSAQQFPQLLVSQQTIAGTGRGRSAPQSPQMAAQPSAQQGPQLLVSQQTIAGTSFQVGGSQPLAMSGGRFPVVQSGSLSTSNIPVVQSGSLSTSNNSSMRTSSLSARVAVSSGGFPLAGSLQAPVTTMSPRVSTGPRVAQVTQIS